MKLTDKTDYSLRVVIYLLRKKEKATIQEIADFHQISKNHLKVVVHQLSTLGVVDSLTGPQGGISFNPNFSTHRVGNLIQQLEKMDIVDCFESPMEAKKCVIDGRCKLKGILKTGMRSFIKELNNYTLQDLA